MPTYKDVDEIRKEIEAGKKNLHFKSAENAQVCAGVLAFVEGVIDRVPSVEVEPVKHGKWLNYYGNYETAECSVCEELYEVSDTKESNRMLFEAFCQYYKHCPNCGAKMDGKEVQE